MAGERKGIVACFEVDGVSVADRGGEVADGSAGVFDGGFGRGGAGHVVGVVEGHVPLGEAATLGTLPPVLVDG